MFGKWGKLFGILTQPAKMKEIATKVEEYLKTTEVELVSEDGSITIVANLANEVISITNKSAKSQDEQTEEIRSMLNEIFVGNKEEREKWMKEFAEQEFGVDISGMIPTA